MGEPQKTFSEAEVEAIVEAKVAKAVEKILGTLNTAREGAGTTAQGGDMQFAQGLALAIANLANQGQNAKVYVDPAVLAERAEARERMTDAIIAAQAENRLGRYQLRSKVFLNERLIEPFWMDKQTSRPTEIEWSGVPSEAMVPLNETAKEIHKLFLASIGSKTDLYTPDGKAKLTPRGHVVIHGRPAAARATAPGYTDSLNLPSGRTPDGLLHVLGTVVAPVQDAVNTGRGG